MENQFQNDEETWFIELAISKMKFLNESGQNQEEIFEYESIEEFKKIKYKADIAQSLASMGLFKKSVFWVNLMEDSREKTTTCLKLAKFIAGSGKFGSGQIKIAIKFWNIAIDSVAAFPLKYRPGNYAEIAQELYISGQMDKAFVVWDKACDTAVVIDDEDYKTKAYAEISRSFSCLDLIEKAVSVIYNSNLNNSSQIKCFRLLISGIKNKKYLKEFIFTLENYSFSLEVKSKVYEFLLQISIKSFNEIPVILPLIIEKLYESKENLYKALFAWAFYLWINNRNLSLLFQIGEVLDIKWMLESFEY